MDLGIEQAVAQDLALDVGAGDITAQLIPQDTFLHAHVISREPAVVCGVAWFNEVFRQIDSNVTIEWLVQEGDRVEAGQELLKLEGRARSIVTAERTALNWLQTLSGTATEVRHFVDLLQPYHTQLLDTRKTLPGLRRAQKYAVSVAGGTNHRIGLYDAFLIKENHIASAGSIDAVVKQARQLHPKTKLEIEVENLQQLQQAIDAKADVVMLDNFSIADIEQAVALTKQRVKLEVSGNVDASQLVAIAKTGVDYVSVGALTKHVRAIDLSLRFLR